VDGWRNQPITRFDPEIGILSAMGILRQLWRFKINRLRTRSGMKLIEHVAAQMGGIKNERHVRGYEHGPSPRQSRLGETNQVLQCAVDRPEDLSTSKGWAMS
jgi:hypothetical protein